jgi:two-component system, LuxR family, sensor kinase FixL
VRIALQAAGTAGFGRRRLPPVHLCAAYLAAYVLLDWASFMHAFSDLGITPWNPPPGLSFAFLAAFGLGAAPMLFVAALAAELIVRGMAAPAPAVILAALAPTAVYSSACWLLVGRLRVDLAVARLRDLAWLLFVAALASALTAWLIVAIYLASGMLARSQALEAAARYALGDFLGVILTAPLLLRLPQLRLRRFANLEWAALAAIIGGLLWLVFAFDPDRTFRHFYVLFIPLAWAAARDGLDGAAVASLLIQFGVISASLAIGLSDEVVVELQAMMLAVAVTTLVIGAAADEARRAEAQRRLLHDRFSHLARLSLGVEVGSALAHEMNQPLAAVANYVRAARTMLDREPPDLEGARQAVLKADAQAMRAGDTVRRLRSFLRRGELQLAPVDLRTVAADALELAAGAAQRRGVEIELEGGKEAATVLADRVHATQATLNLMLNGLDAAAAAPQGWVRVRIEQTENEGVLTVTDSGPGPAAEIEGRLFEPFITTKPEGMGLGLSVSLTLVQAQGGRLWYVPPEPEHPHSFKLALPLAGRADA